METVHANDPQAYCEEVHDILYQQMGYDGYLPTRLYTSTFLYKGKAPQECALAWYNEHKRALGVNA